MVLKKPYGLMIKHFKLIHFILLVLSAFVMLQVRNIVGFFNDFIANGYMATVFENMASNYISIFVYFALIIMIGLLVALIILLKYKKKPKNIYVVATVYYVILFIGIIIAARLFNGLEESLWSTTAARMYRDISTILSIPQYAFIPMWLIRALGFNIKQFNFQSDLAELDLIDADSEEVEINIGFETYKAQRKARRIFREFKYYFYENKFIMFSILTICIVVMIYLFISNFEIYKHKYKIGQAFTVNNFNVVVEDSIITNLTYAGEKVSNDGYYLVLKLTITNNSTKEEAFEYNQFIVYGKNHYYLPNLSVSNSFMDYGEGYTGDKISPKSTKTIVIPYAINKESANEKLYVSIYNGMSKNKKDYHFKSIQVDLNSIVIDQIAIVQTSSLNTPVVFNSTYLNNTTLNIPYVEITSRYTYDYEVCSFSGCNTFKNLITPEFLTTKQTLIVLDYDLQIDQDTPYAKTNSKISSFASNFFTIRYTVDGSSYIQDIKNLTPDNLKNKFVLQVNADVENASRVDLLVTIRNKTYVINLVNK